jgi:hypothetical protein
VRALPAIASANHPGGFYFDPEVKTLAASLGDGSNTSTLFGLPTLDARGVTRAPLGCLSPNARWSVNLSSDQPSTIALYDLAAGEPVLRLAQDVEARQHSFNFGPDGRHVVIGRRDGKISVLDLVEVNEQLNDLRLGWPLGR